MKVRHAAPDDVPALLALVHRTIETSYGDVYPPLAIAFFKQFHSRAEYESRMRDGLVLVAERDGQIVGTGSMVRGKIFAVFVDPDAQGTGTGRELMERLEGSARERGIERTELDVSLPSRQFYERLGYTMDEDRERDLGDGQTLRFWSASKQLGGSALQRPT